ncbi:MAG: esterase [Acidimicrobiales bacterium]|nr:esterase [Acidimicrobiales bacterium]
MAKPVLEPAAQAFVEATNDPPFLFDLEPTVGRKTVDEVQSPEIDVPGTDTTTITVPGGPSGSVSVTIFRPTGLAGPLPVIIFIHGAGWVFGNDHTHGRLARELATGAGAAVVFPNYSLSPEARFPTAIEENYAVAQWVMTSGADNGLDSSRVAVAGDSVGGDMAASLTITAKERGDVRLAAQVLFYPVTNAAFDTGSYEEFAAGYFLRRDGMQWFWDQYTTDPVERRLPTASPLQASTEQLAGLPPALVITGEADVLRDEGEAYANRLRAAGVPVTATRYQGIIHDFVMLNALRETNAAEAAIAQAIDFLAKRLGTRI